MKTITVIGGGTGTFVVLSGLKKYPIDLGVIVTMMDSGGSTGRLRDQLGVLPPGDLRQCLVALSEAPLLWRKLFLYRFESGDFYGHNFGNVFLSALEKVTSNYNEVIKMVSYILNIKGKVIPVTFKKTDLCAKYNNGKIVKSEKNIDENINEASPIKEVFLKPKVDPSSQAIQRIKASDFLVIGPGDLYTSIIPVLLVNKIKDTIISSKAKIIYVLNLMTKSGQTTNYKASTHIRELEKYLGRDINYLIVNKGKIPADILKWYFNHNEKPVLNDLQLNNLRCTMIVEDIIDKKKIKINKIDRVTRSILRHSSQKLAEILIKIII